MLSNCLFNYFVLIFFHTGQMHSEDLTHPPIKMLNVSIPSYDIAWQLKALKEVSLLVAEINTNQSIILGFKHKNMDRIARTIY